jgi:uncharacterized protein YndB with AHSA1/START domain
MTGLDHALERSVTIVARRETVFRYFTDTGRFAAWWGEGSSIEPRPGGAVRIRFPNGIVAGGQVLEIEPVERIVFTYGFESGQPIAIGASRVSVRLEETPRGTLVRLRHELPTAAARDEHVQGWRYQLALFANVVAKEEHQAIGDRVDRFFAVWTEPEAAKRRAELTELATDDLAFRDPYSCTVGIDDLVAHIGAAQLHMPGMRLERQGDARQCQGTVAVSWVAKTADGAERGRGTNVFDLAPDGRIARATGLWG